MLPRDLLDTAKHLAAAGAGKPKEAHLRRAISTTYYALFHTLAKACADSVVGTVKAKRSKPAWRQVYRSLGHGAVKTACAQKTLLGKFPIGIQDFANLLIAMQEKRHDADYDPYAKPIKSAVLSDISLAEVAITNFAGVSLKHRRAFAAFVLLKQPHS